MPAPFVIAAAVGTTAVVGGVSAMDSDFRESLPTAVKIALPVLTGFALAPAIGAALGNLGSAIGASTTAASGLGAAIGNVLTSSAAAHGLGALIGSAAVGNKVDAKNIALALLPGAVEGKTFLGTTISPVIAQSMAIGGGVSGDYQQALVSGMTAGMIESSLNTKIGQWITNKASSFGLSGVSGLKEALLVGGSVGIYENQRQQLLDMQKAMQAEYDRLYKEEMEKARQAELAAMQAEEARLNRLYAQEEEWERQRVELAKQLKAKAEERERIETPLRNKAFIRSMRARTRLEEVRGLYAGLQVNMGLAA